MDYLRLVLCIKVLLKKGVDFKYEEATFPLEFIVFILFFIKTIMTKNVAKIGGFRKKIKTEDSHIGDCP